jgi:hypothetical protein
VVVLSLVLAVVALVVAILAIRRADVVEKRARQRRSANAHSDEPTASAGTVADRPADSIGTDLDNTEVYRRLAALESRPSGGISRVAVVRYDAFDDVGGQLSYSAALVDNQGQGLVLTAIHGRSETRTYVKQVPSPADSGRGAELSPEEREALREAAKLGASGTR